MLIESQRFVHLLLLESERAWAEAMHEKSTHSADSGAKGITGSTKRHIASRLHKATVYAEHLLHLLEDRTVSKASTLAILEARAYYISLKGAIEFEKQNWEKCLHDFAEARLIYTTLARSQGLEGDDLFEDLLSSNIDPSIRYAAYQLKLPRTTSIDTIITRYAPLKSNKYVAEVLKQDPDALDDPATSQKKIPSGHAENVPKTIQWRARTVNLEDAATAQALAAVSAAEFNLSSFLSSNPDASPQAIALAYDEVLIPSQDAVDCTKTAIDELSAEGVSQSDGRMQALQMTRTALNYALVGWRIGRNRILCGEQDGTFLETRIKRSRKSKEGAKTVTVQEDSTSRKLTKLRERVVLYDTTLQSIDSVKDLPGVAADQAFVEELESKRAYFAALRCLAIARSHGLLQNIKNALALFSRALNLSSHALKQPSPTESHSRRPPMQDVTSAQAKSLYDLLQSLVSQHRALMELHILSATASTKSSVAIPLVEQLTTYPSNPVDLTNLVAYPPKVEPIPVKPLFLDVAYNYIEYPGRQRKFAEKAVNGTGVGQAEKEGKKEVKKGWFGFVR